jgi:uncharacterized protein (TIGR03067 family)
MKPYVVGLTLVLLTAVAGLADDAKEEAIQRERKRLAGTWRVVALEINGEKSADEETKKLTVVNGDDGAWSLLAEGKEISRGTSTLDPTKKPKTIDFTPTAGEGKGQQYVGVYELGEATRKLCFVSSGKDRPSEFSSKSGSERILVTFERVRELR